MNFDQQKFIFFGFYNNQKFQPFISYNHKNYSQNLREFFDFIIIICDDFQTFQFFIPEIETCFKKAKDSETI